MVQLYGPCNQCSPCFLGSGSVARSSHNSRRGRWMQERSNGRLTCRLPIRRDQNAVCELGGVLCPYRGGRTNGGATTQEPTQGGQRRAREPLLVVGRLVIGMGLGGWYGIVAQLEHGPGFENCTTTTVHETWDPPPTNDGRERKTSEEQQKKHRQ